MACMSPAAAVVFSTTASERDEVIVEVNWTTESDDQPAEIDCMHQISLGSLRMHHISLGL